MATKTYRIIVRGRLTERLASAFEGMTLEPGRGETGLVGEVADQAHLFGLLDCVRNFGLELVRVEPAAPASPASAPCARFPSRSQGPWLRSMRPRLTSRT